MLHTGLSRLQNKGVTGSMYKGDKDCASQEGAAHGATSVCQDIARPDPVEKEMERRLDYERAAVACMRVLMRNEELHDQMPVVLNIMLQAARVDRAYIFENSEDGEKGTCMS